MDSHPREVKFFDASLWNFIHLAQNWEALWEGALLKVKDTSVSEFIFWGIYMK